MEEIRELYHKYAPRWVKAIRWQDARTRFVQGQLHYLKVLYIPGAATFIFCQQNPFATALVWYRPKTQEEVDNLKRNYSSNVHQRNWKINEYPTKQMPPMWDLAERRSKYPHYYGDRYSGTLKEGVYSKSDYIDNIPRRELVSRK